jgi:hypothetical protein
VVRKREEEEEAEDDDDDVRDWAFFARRRQNRVLFELDVLSRRLLFVASLTSRMAPRGRRRQPWRLALLFSKGRSRKDEGSATRGFFDAIVCASERVEPVFFSPSLSSSLTLGRASPASSSNSCLPLFLFRSLTARSCRSLIPGRIASSC